MLLGQQVRYIAIVQMETLRPGEETEPSQSHRAGQWQSSGGFYGRISTVSVQSLGAFLR